MAVPIPFLILAGAFAVKALAGRQGNSPACRNPSPQDLARHRAEKLKFLQTYFGTPNLAPKRVLHWDGSPVTVGQLKLTWVSNGPWGPCDQRNHSLRSKPLANASVAQANVPVDLAFMLGGDPWSDPYGSDALLLQVGSQDSQFFSQKSALPHSVVAIPGAPDFGHPQGALTGLADRQSWIEAQVETAGQTWATGPIATNYYPNAKVNPESIYGAYRATQSGDLLEGPDGEYLYESGAQGVQITGPDALVLLRTDEGDLGATMSLFDKKNIDYVVIQNAMNADVLFVGSQWLSEDRVAEALFDPGFQSRMEAVRPNEAPRAIDVLLWLMYLESAKALGGDDPLPGGHDYLNAMGNENSPKWAALYEKKPGFLAVRQRFLPDVHQIMGTVAPSILP